jgi:hypothetical protein
MNCVKTIDRSHASRNNALHAAAIMSSSPIHHPIPSKKLHKDISGLAFLMMMMMMMMPLI